MFAHRPHELRAGRDALRGALLAALWAFAGCATPPSANDLANLTQSERLQRQYPDLSSGRFAVIADFEDAAHAGLFRLEPAATDALRPDDDAGVKPTGGTALRADFVNSNTRLIADSRNTRDWALVRDWRPYDLLLMSIFAPAPDVQVDFAVVAGREAGQVEAHSLVPLQTGWNLIRLDLSEAGEILPLDDVQQVRWSVSGRSTSTPLVFDDLVLADNRRIVFGDEAAGRGKLYAVQEGRRISVGAAGRFELSFANGQIVRWHALDRDPQRQHNLVGRGSTLGPMPIVLPSADASSLDDEQPPRWPAGFSELGNTIATRQRLLEANEVFVQVECLWTFAEAPAEDDSAARQRWLYTIYASGHVYTTVEATTAHGPFRAEHLGLVVTRHAQPGLQAGVHEPAGLDERTALRHVCYGWIGGGDQAASLIFVPRDSRRSPQIRVVENTESSRISLIAFGGDSNYPVSKWAALLAIWPPAIAAPTLREDLALGYAAPQAFEIIVGHLDVTEASPDGFDTELGAYAIQPKDGVVKIRWGGSDVPLTMPTFQVRGVHDQEAWVYVNDRLHTPVARTSDGDLVFQVSAPSSPTTAVDVYLGRSPASTP